VATALTPATRFGRLSLRNYGADFIDTLQRLLLHYQDEGFEAITVHLPLSDPLTSYFGAGLSELGLSFNAVLPEQAQGDELVLGLCTTDQDPQTIAVASDLGAQLRDFVLADRAGTRERFEVRARSRATMARILDGL